MTKPRTRRDKLLENDKPQTKKKFLEVAQELDNTSEARFTAANPKQKQALAMLASNLPVVFLKGSAGTGKSMLAAYRASTLIQQKKIDKVYLVRPAVAVGKSVGLLPGTLEEKLEPYFAQTLAHFEKFLGKAKTKYCLDHDQIEYKGVEYLRGVSFENCVVILEESQNFTAEEFKMLLTRIGENSTLIFTGDENQHDLRGNSGLTQTIDLIRKTVDAPPDEMSDDEVQLIDDMIGVVEFTPDDVVRSGLTKSIVKMYYYE